MGTAAYNLSPVLQLLLMGLAVAFGPLAWVWLRNAGPRRRLKALALLTLFLTFDLVMFGAFTRLTDSGLGCPDWPGCYGHASPIGASAPISAAQAQMPTGPVTHGKAWIEMIHRYLAMGVGVLIVTITAGSWFERRRGADVNAWWPTFTLLWVCLQGAFGALTVTMKLFPAIVTMHLLGGIVLLALLCAQAVALRPQAGATPVTPALRGWLAAAFAMLWVQIALGGWVSTNYAVLACTGFPLCQGSWWPTMDFREGFEIWRALGLTSAGEPVTFAALTAIHYTHRLVAYALLPVLGLVAARLLRIEGLRAQGRWLALLVVLQLGTGLSNVVLGWPLAGAVLHTGGAAALVGVLTWAWRASRTLAAGRRATMMTTGVSA